MRKTVPVLFVLVSLFCFFPLTSLRAQVSGPIVCPISAGADQTICAPNCANLTGTYVNSNLPGSGANAYTSVTVPYAPDPYTVGTAIALADDQWSGVINLPFPFCFYGTTYTQCLIGSNGLVTFNIGTPNGYCPWPIPATNAPTATYGWSNGIGAPWQDLYPPAGGTIRYTTYGTAPCRRFVVSWYNVPMYSCTSTLLTQQVVLYETTNVIDNYIQVRSNCGWNSGRAVQCVMNNGGTQAVVVAGRNALNAGWTTTNDGKRYYPNGATNVVVGWYQGAALVSATANATVCPTATTTYTFQATYTNCNGTTVTVSDQMIVNASSLTVTTSPNPTICGGASTLLTSSAPGAIAYQWTQLPANTVIAVTPNVTVSPTVTTSYVITATAASGCQGSQTVVVTVSAPTITTVSQTNLSCNSVCNGSVVNSVSGGTGPYTFSWTPMATNSTVGATNTGSSLCAGTYTITATDATGCTSTITITITQPPAITLTAAQTNITCFGACNGSATVTASGGNGTYSYSWSPSGGTGPSASALCPGLYTCTVSSPAGCTATQTFNITQPPAITLTATQTNITCNGGCSGGASVVASGGNGTYTYAWLPSGGTGSTANALCAGTYTCTVSSPAGCTATQSFNITQPPALTVTAVSSPVLCFGGSTGSATVTASGGSGAYTYLWAPSGGTGSTAIGLSANTYTVTVTDANGCTATATTTVTQPTLLSATATSSPVLCNGGSTGSATVTAAGGTGPYTYSWAPIGGTATTATGLNATTYTVTVTDANGCTITATTTVTQPTALVATTSFTQATCNASNGSASVNVTGGVGPYTYSWAPSGGTGSTATGLSSQVYTVTFTDANNCTGTATVNVPNAASPTATITATTNVSCFGGTNGSATVAASGGTAPYTYAWLPSGGTGTTASGLNANSYTVTVTDANGCSITASTIITQPTVLTATASSSPVLCFGGSTGSATVIPTGGVTPYTYSWAPAGGTAATATGLNATSYTVTVTDANGCSTTASTTVTQPTALTASAASSPVLCNGGATGSATVTPGGGIGPYTYNWSPSVQTTATATNLTAQVYTVTVTDANGCTVQASTTVTQPGQLSATTSFTQSTCGLANGEAMVICTLGTAPYTYLWSPSGNMTTNPSGLLAGPYTCLITDANGCTLSVSVTVTNAGSPTVTIVASDSVSCFGGNDGWAACSTIGGTTPYTYLWSNSDADTLAGNLTMGSYTVTVTDANGCTHTATVPIGEPPLLTISATSTDVLCFGGSTGTASSTAAGGTGSYTYTWSPSGGTSANATALPQAIYTVVVTDANGCSAQATTTVSEPPLLTLTATFTPVSCNGGTDATITATPGGGFGSYSYNWTPGPLTNQTETGLPQGTYVCVVTDGNMCTASATTTVTEPTAIVTTSTAVDANCNQSNGSVSANATGGTGTLNYQWQSGGPATANWNNISSGTYTVIVTDQNGCADTLTQAVQNLNGVNAVLNSSTNLTCFNSANGFIDVDAAGGTAPYTYGWSPNVAVTTDTASGLSAGQYTIVVSDATGCTSTVTVLLTEPSLLTVQASANPSAVCEGSPIQLNSNAGGGTPGYTYSWTPFTPPMSGQSQNITPLATTTYTVTVTDANGCTATSPILVTVNPMPTALFQGDLLQGCAPVCVNFSDLSTVASGTITGWSWDFGDNTTSTQQNPTQHCYANPGAYTVILTVTTASGCTETITMANYINVFAMPVAAFGASPQPTTITNPEIFFTDSSTNASTWLWSFGDVPGSTSTDQNPSFTYPDPQCYLVELEVTSADGCVDTDTQTVCIAPDVSVYVPNTFTPDGNGMNDVFTPVTIGIDPNKYELWIFDRWGNMIFYTDVLDAGWDGRVYGHTDIVQQDTYVWRIKAKDVLGKQHNLVGHVNVIK